MVKGLGFCLVLPTIVSADSTILLSSLKVKHQIDSDVFHLAVESPHGTIQHTLTEFKIFGEGFKEIQEDGTAKYLQPSFRTFETLEGPRIRVMLQEDGRFHTWMPLGGHTVRLSKHVDDEHVNASKVLSGIHKDPPTEDEDKKEKKWHKAHGEVLSKGCKKICKKERTSAKCQECSHLWIAIDDDNIPTSNDDNSQDAAPEVLLQFESGTVDWGGNKWWPGCYPGDNQRHKMLVGAMVNNMAREGDDWNLRSSFQGYHGNFMDEVAWQFNEANTIYANQLNIDLTVGFTLSYANDGGPAFFQKSYCTQSGYNIGDELQEVVDFARAGFDGKADGKVAATHLFSGCNAQGYGTVGVAYVGTLCNNGYNTGVDHINAGWTTFAHELGHNFNAKHSWEDGKHNTGGIMDYGDGKLNGHYQFHTKYRKDEVCSHLTSVKDGSAWGGGCTSSAFDGVFVPKSGGSTPPRRRAPPRRRRAPVRRRQSGGSSCEGATDQQPASSCAYWKGEGFCTTGQYVSYMEENCAKTCCEEENGPAPTPPPPTPPPPTPPPPAPTGSNCDSKQNIQSAGNCDYWAKTMGYCTETYVKFMSDNCAKACCEKASSTGGSDGSDGSDGDCVAPGSIQNTAPNCQKCRESKQCASPGYCCPYMKTCILQGESCYYPIANCQPVCHTADCDTCSPKSANGENISYKDWGLPTCTVLLQSKKHKIPPPPVAPEHQSRIRKTKFSGQVVGQVAADGTVGFD